MKKFFLGCLWCLPTLATPPNLPLPRPPPPSPPHPNPPSLPFHPTMPNLSPFPQVNELFNRELSDAGYAGVEIRNAPIKTEMIIRAANPVDVVGEKSKRIRELTSVVQKRFKFAEGALELFAARVQNRGLSAQAQVSLSGRVGDGNLDPACPRPISAPTPIMPAFTHATTTTHPRPQPLNSPPPYPFQTHDRPSPSSSSFWEAWPCAAPPMV